jgi:type IV secretory pathway VirB3-like protein
MSTALDNIKYNFGKFIGPAVAFIIGLIIYIYSKTQIIVDVYDPNKKMDLYYGYTQESLFGMGGLLLMLIAIVWILFAINVIKSFLILIVTVILIAVGILVLYKDYKIVKEDIDATQRKNLVMKETKMRLNDIKLAEKEYKREKGVYTASIDTLIEFIKNGKRIDFVRQGPTPNRRPRKYEYDWIYPGQNKPLDNNLTDIEAKALLYFYKTKTDSLPQEFVGYVRDTVYVSVFETVFGDDDYVEMRKKQDYMFDFVPDSLRYLPFSGQKSPIIETDSITRGEVKISTILIKAIHPSYPKDTLKIGSKTENNLKDNWSY